MDGTENETMTEVAGLDIERGLTEREIGSLQTWMKSVDEKLGSLLSAWVGNGKPGLKQELVVIRTRLEDLEKWKDQVDTILRYFAIAFALFCTGILWGILTDKIDIIVK